MPLSPPVAREAIHHRRVHCSGYRRADGLWDIEGHLVDTKTYGFPNQHRGRVEAGEPVHQMWLRLTIDDALLIHAAEAVTEHAPYDVCPAITPNFAQLAGLKIGPGFRHGVNQRLGGAHGCTHLVELLQPMATTAYQTVFPWLGRGRKREEIKQRPGHLDTCHALASDGEVVRRFYPQFYTGNAPREGAKE